MQRQRPENFYLREAIPGLYFRADDPRRHGIIMEAARFVFYSEPRAYPEYDGWCVVPFRGMDPEGAHRIGVLSPGLGNGSVSRNHYGQITDDGVGMCLSYDPRVERFSRDIYAIRDEDVPEVEPAGWFVFEPAVSGE